MVRYTFGSMQGVAIVSTSTTGQKPGLIDLLIDYCGSSSELMADIYVKSGFEHSQVSEVIDRLKELSLISKYPPEKLREYPQAKIDLSCDARIALGLYQKWFTDQGGLPFYPPDTPR